MSAPVPDPRSRMFPPAVLVVSVLAAVGLQWLWPVHLIGPPLGRWIGGALVFAWLVLAVFAVGVFRRAGTTPNPTGDVTAFVTAGPFRWTRNPMYLGLVLAQAGGGFLLGNGWMLILLPPLFFVLDRVVIVGEERYLEGKYGAPYNEYRQRVRRWL